MQEISGFPSFRRKMQMQDPLEFPFPYITQYIYNWMDKRPENFTPPAKPRHRTCAGGSVPQGSPAHHWQVMIGTAVGPRLLAPGTAAQRNLRGRGVDSSTWLQYGKKTPAPLNHASCATRTSHCSANAAAGPTASST